MYLIVNLWCVLAFFALSAAAAATGRRPLASPLIYGASAAVSLAGLILALAEMTGAPMAAALPLGLPWLGAHFRVDALSAFFLAIVNFGGLAASIYAIGYGRHESAPQRILPFFASFLAGMNLVALADDAFTFLIAWEFMSLSSWALVMAHHREPENRRAGYIYLVMAAFGTFCLLLAFGLLAGPAGGYTFAEMRAHAQEPLTGALVLVLLLLGAGSKAGLVPLHVWLPLAHPAAPSHVSALMSGVMTKIAIYGFIRIVFDLLGPPEWWWALPVLALGGVTAVAGVLYALMQSDMKRLLAYSTVENVGIVFIGLGLALAFRANGMDAAAALALTAALMHALNHMLFKSLLFFGAGAILNATGLRDIEKLGGLIRLMPATALFFLAGSAAISALPPFNGFVSEWMTFQAILLSPALPQWGLKLMVPAVGAGLALAAAFAAACYVRAFGIVFLSQPRSGAASMAREADRFSLAAMAALAALCLLLGVMPGLAIDALAPVAQGLIGTHMPRQLSEPWLSIVPIAESRSSYNGLLVLLFITTSATAAVLAIHRFASRAVRRAPSWDCGYAEGSPMLQYSASGFSQPLRRIFGTLAYRIDERVDMPAPGDTRAARYRLELRDMAWETLYAPLAGVVMSTAEYLNRFQFLTIRRYLSLVFFALILLLIMVAAWP